MVLPEGLVAELKKRAKAKRRNGIFHRGGDSYLFRKKIRGHLYQIPFRAGSSKDAKLVYDQILLEISLGLHGGGKAPDLSSIIEGWCRLHRKQEDHVKNARWAEEALKDVPKGMTPLPDLPLPSITTERVETWICHYQDGRSPATINHVLRYLKLWMRWAVKRKTPGLPGMPYDVPMRKVERVAKPVVKIPHQDAFFQGVDCIRTWVRVSQLADLEVRVAVRMMLGLGLREKEVLGARREWLDLDARTYTVGKAKGMRPRTLGIPDWVESWLRALPVNISGLLFVDEEGKRHSQGWLRKALARGARMAGVKGTMGNHRLRASFASRHNAVGTSTRDIQDMMGHGSITTTQLYIEPDQERRQAAQDALAAKLKRGS